MSIAVDFNDDVVFSIRIGFSNDHKHVERQQASRFWIDAPRYSSGFDNKSPRFDRVTHKCLGLVPAKRTPLLI
jgi:hypothetical protein